MRGDIYRRIALIRLIIVGAMAVALISHSLDSSAAGQRGVPGVAALTPYSVTDTMAPFAGSINAAIGAHDIVIAQGRLVYRANSYPFVPRGNSYLRMEPLNHAGITFDPGVYDPAITDAVFTTMAGYGYNTVRLFVWPTHLGNPSGPGLSDAYLANLTDALYRATAHGIAPLLSIGGLPPTGGYRPTTVDPPQYATDPAISTARVASRPSAFVTASGNPSYYNTNWRFLTQQGYDLTMHYATDLMTGLQAHGAPFGSIFAYDLTGEIGFLLNRYPLSVSSGTTVTHTGIYDLGDAASREQMLADNLTAYLSGFTATIKAFDPGAITSVQLPPPAINPDPTVLYPSGNLIARVATTVDMLTLSLYPTYDKDMATVMGSYGLSLGSLGKPLITLEMGWLSYYLQGHPELTMTDLATRIVQWESDSCAYGVLGWYFFTWNNAHSDTPFLNATEDNALLASALAPTAVPDPCGVLTPHPVQPSRSGSSAPNVVVAPPAPRPLPPSAPGPAPLPIHR